MTDFSDYCGIFANRLFLHAMKKFLILSIFFTLIITMPTLSQSTVTRIRHTVVFNLKHLPGSTGERDFLNAIMKLSAIPGVQNFECMKQVSKKNPYTFGLSMEFTDQAAYDRYSNHPDHNAFVEQRWMKEVEAFLEVDYALPPMQPSGQ